jgi:hypothetical protein
MKPKPEVRGSSLGLACGWASLWMVGTVALALTRIRNIVFRFSLYLDYRCDYYMETFKLILAPSGIARGRIITVKDTNLTIGEVVVRRPIPLYAMQ